MSRFFAVAVVLGLMSFGCAEKKVATQPDQPLDQTRAKTEQAKGPEKITEQQIAKVDSQDLGARPEEVRGACRRRYPNRRRSYVGPGIT